MSPKLGNIPLWLFPLSLSLSLSRKSRHSAKEAKSPFIWLDWSWALKPIRKRKCNHRAKNHQSAYTTVWLFVYVIDFVWSTNYFSIWKHKLIGSAHSLHLLLCFFFFFLVSVLQLCSLFMSIDHFQFEQSSIKPIDISKLSVYLSKLVWFAWNAEISDINRQLRHKKK